MTGVIDKIRILNQYLQVSFRREFATRDELMKWQTEQFAAFSDKTLSLSPFYDDYRNSTLNAYPLIDKKIWVENFDQINTKGLSGKALFEIALDGERTRKFDLIANQIAVGLSSGTSGRRALFATDRYERAKYAGTIIAKCLGKDAIKKQRIALLFRANNPLYETIGSNRIKFQFFDLQKAWSEILRGLNTFQPSVLVGPPQVLALVAKAQSEGQVRLKPVKIFAGGEVLEEKARPEIEAAFGLKVGQIYQATEGFLGVSCKFGTIHLNEDAIIVEKQYIDERRFVPVITDFVRTTQPLVRYRLNDILIEKKERCECGSIFTAIEKIEGREDDILMIENEASTIVPVMPDFVRDAMALSHDSISDYRLIQRKIDELEIAVDGPQLERAREKAVATLTELFDDLNLKMPQLVFADAITSDMRDMRVKLRRVQRLFPMTEVTR